MKISIFIPTYNSGEILKETQDSVLGQTHQDLETLCVDDSSTDNGLTWGILNEYAAKDSRVRIFQKPNQGCVPFSWNYILPKISGEFTFYMSHDDILEPEAIAKMVKIADSDPEIDHVLVKMIQFEHDYMNPEPEFSWQNKKFNDMCARPAISGKDAFVESLDYGLPGFGIWRTELIKQLGVPTDTFNGDDYMHRIWKLHCRKVAFSDARFFYRQNPNGILKGFKPYHYKGLVVHDRLAEFLDEVKFITPGRYAEVIYNWYKWLRMHNAWFSTHPKQYSNAERKEIKKCLRQSHRIIGSRVTAVPKGINGKIVKMSSRCYPLFRLLGHFDKV